VSRYYCLKAAEINWKSNAAKTEPSKVRRDQTHLPVGVALKPPVRLEELKSDTEYDPEGRGRIRGDDPNAS